MRNNVFNVKALFLTLKLTECKLGCKSVYEFQKGIRRHETQKHFTLGMGAAWPCKSTLTLWVLTPL